ncbi:protein YLS3-like [Senna tora]|uniref:Protein YLS3-like n=1 Tax=Senna tora TaxID=362788 RepID=A0A834WIW8_9FABA|nr:protein YLS3-like [Senna tora]
MVLLPLPYTARATAVVVAACLVVAMSIGAATGDDASKDKEECTEQLAGLATCLPFVGGQAKSPTPDCCSGLKQVLKSNKKCLCVIVKDRNDPDIGSLQINVTLALSLPTVCNAPANVSKCPELLHMDPKSAEAQVFYQLDKKSSKGASTPTPSPSGGTSGDNGKSQGKGASSQETSATQKNEGYYNGNRSFGLHILVSGLLVWAFMGSTTLSLGL